MSNCKDCFNGCPDDKIFDKCVRYTGADIDELDICNGNTFDEILDKVVTRILSYSDGSGISPTVDTSCSFFSGIIGTQTKTLNNILQSLITGECSLKTSITNLENKATPPYSFDTGCLTVL